MKIRPRSGARNALLVALLALSAACAKAPLQTIPGTYSMAALEERKTAVDGLWLINTATAVVEDSHLHDGGSSDPVSIPILCALIKHGDDYVLVDTGLNHHFAFDPKNYLGSVVYFFAKRKAEMPQMSQGQDVVAQLTKLGLTPESVGTILLTHPHFDHTGEIPAFREARILAGPETRTFVQRAFGATRGVMTTDVPLDRLEEVAYERKAFLTFPARFDLYGDGSVVLVPTPGHTPGALSVFVRTAAGDFLLVGDAAYTAQNLEKPVNIGYFEDREKTWDSLIRFHDLHGAAPEITIIPFHDPKYLESGADGPARIDQPQEKAK
ncbi:MAG: N-acyl homoserine lactonase family protein [Deltaproteobacteria bacterium]|nr:N-acyl homoserine lactonase family protein [Deltaproteobacteria bacterium]